MGIATRKTEDLQVLQVYVLRDGRFWGSDCFSQKRIRIGCSKDADLRLEDERVSRIHASLVIGAEGMVLVDEESSCGTLLNGQFIETEQIGPLDEVSVGPFVLKFKLLERAHRPGEFGRDTTDVTEVGRVSKTEGLTVIEPAARRGEVEGKQDPEEPPGESPVPADLAGEPYPTTWSEYDEWEEQDPAAWVEPFSLLNNLVGEDFTTPRTDVETSPVLEVIGYTSEREVIRYEQLRKGKRLSLNGHRYARVHYDDSDGCQLTFTENFSGGLMDAGQTIALEQVKTTSARKGKHRGTEVWAHRLRHGDYANLVHPGGGTFLRFVQPPKIEKTRWSLRPDWLKWKIFGATFAGQALLLLCIGLLLPKPEAVARPETDSFARMNLQDITMTPPEIEAPEPTPLPAKVIEPQEVLSTPQPIKKPERARTRNERRGKPQAASGGGAGMKMMLAQLNKKKDTGILSSATNLEAVRVPNGGSRYQVSGPMVKAPTNKLLVSSDRGKGFKASWKLLRPGDGDGNGIGPGKLKPGVIGTRHVGGVVIGPRSKRKILTPGGWLTRQQIEKVVRRHLAKIQYCYERNLLLKPGLKGQLHYEWLVNRQGRVTVVRTTNDTFSTPAVGMCVGKVIKKMRFPKPKGPVKVGFPFLFAPIGF